MQWQIHAPGESAAIDREHLAGDVVGRGRGQEQRDVRDVGRCSEPPQWDVLQQRPDFLIRGRRVKLDVTRGDKFTLMRASASSIASVLVNMTMPAFDAQ